MRKMIVILAIAALVGFSAAAATCASGPFQQSCSACTFDAQGKMNPGCWKTYENEGKTCLATSYPGMAFAYQFGDGCPQLDTCVSRLSACKEAAKSGSDARDCNSAAMLNCYRMGDACAAAASKVCSDGKSEDEAGFNEQDAGGTKPPKNEMNDDDAQIGWQLDEAFCPPEPAFLLFLLLAVLRRA